MTSQAAQADAAAQHDGHPFDYYRRDGMALRPAPPRVRFDDIWTPARQNILEGWIDFQTKPRETEPVRKVIDHMWQGDELMDAVVEQFREMGMAEGRKLLDQALDHGIESVPDAPAELVALFEPLDRTPEWLDWELWERGRVLWNNASLAGGLGMLVGDVFGTFVGDDVAYAVGETGRLVQDNLRRSLETGAWFRAVTLKGALERFAEPFKDTVRVRLMHSQVRAGLRRRWGDDPDAPAAAGASGPRGAFAAHGDPISSAWMMVAATTFALQPLLVDHAHGRTCTWADLDAVTMYWNYIAHVFGVADDIIPRDARAAVEIMDWGVAHAGGPSPWTDVQARAAFDRPGGSGLITRALLTPMLGLMTYYSGERLTRALIGGTRMRDVDLRLWTALGKAFVWGNVGFRRVADVLPGAARRAEARTTAPVYRSHEFMERLAARRGLSGTPFDHHNTTAGVAQGGAIPAPPPLSRCPVPHEPTSCAGRRPAQEHARTNRADLRPEPLARGKEDSR
ncbi:MAG: oxygenase MpaB family protein [Segniliparus sp.]|uniref:oxygenase MpaB family protein n=1 Tax=Segniliparus sp. TaxID=2804064 RepID=UPI003F2DA071